MERFNSKEFYGWSQSGKPRLSPNIRNYEYQYNVFKFERPSSAVKTDMMIRQHNSFLMCKPKSRNAFEEDLAELSDGESIETEIGRSYAPATVIRPMTDIEMQSMFESDGSNQKLRNVRSFEGRDKFDWTGEDNSYIVPWPKSKKPKTHNMHSDGSKFKRRLHKVHN